MSPVDVGIQRGKLVVERIADETLRRQVIALVRSDRPRSRGGSRRSFPAMPMKMNPDRAREEPGEALFRRFQHNPADQAVHFVAFGKQKFGQIGSILSGDACDQSIFGVNLYSNGLTLLLDKGCAPRRCRLFL